MNQLIAQYIEKQTRFIDKNIVQKIYDFLVDNIIITVDDTIVLADMLIYKNISIPGEFTSNCPSAEYTYLLQLDRNDVNITIGIDWFGIRKCGDEYCYYIIISPK